MKTKTLKELLTEAIKTDFSNRGIIVSPETIEKMVESKLMPHVAGLELTQKYGRPAMKVVPTELHSFEKIVTVGNFNNGYYEHLQKNEKCRTAIFAPVTGAEGEELILYYEGENQNISGGKDIYDYFAEKGYEVVEKAHPSLLVNAMAQLTEEKLTELGIPSHVDIVLPTDEASLLPYGGGILCFLEADRSDGRRRLRLVYFGGRWVGLYAFLLRKKL